MRGDHTRTSFLTSAGTLYDAVDSVGGPKQYRSPLFHSGHTAPVAFSFVLAAEGIYHLVYLVS